MRGRPETITDGYEDAADYVFVRSTLRGDLHGLNLEAGGLSPVLTKHSSFFYVMPGVVLCTTISVSAIALEQFETWAFGAVYVDALVLTMLVGIASRSFLGIRSSLLPGLQFCAKTCLEVAVMLLGLSISVETLGALNPTLFSGVLAVVACSLLISYVIGRKLGLSGPVAILIASGNSICGNSAIIAVASALKARPDDVGLAIVATAVVGLIPVLVLPALGAAAHLNSAEYGAVAGLAIYAVPQVISVSAPLGLASLQTATLVKMTRVVTLSPLVMYLSIRHSSHPRWNTTATTLTVLRSIPWFIVGFCFVGAMRLLNIVPDDIVEPALSLANILTMLSMAGLGFGIDLNKLEVSPTSVLATASLAAAALCAISIAFVYLLDLG